MNLRPLEVVITALALADGAIHLTLDFVIFHGRLLGLGRLLELPIALVSAGPEPRSVPHPIQFPLPLSELFFFYFIGYLVLVLVFWLAARWLGWWRWLIDVVLVAYAVAGIVAWLEAGRPNPMELGYLSKGIEMALIAALVVHAAVVISGRDIPSSAL